MKIQKWLRRLNEFLDADLKTQREEIKQLRKILKKLKRKERMLADLLAATTDAAERGQLDEKIQVVHAQRRKGLEHLQALRVTTKKKRD